MYTGRNTPIQRVFLARVYLLSFSVFLFFSTLVVFGYQNCKERREFTVIKTLVSSA